MADNPIPSELQCDHLFLLVGTNPLPNWIAAKLLLRENGTLCLIHSDTTQKVAERISAFAQDHQYPGQVTLVKVRDEHDAASVQQTMQGQLGRIGVGSVGLNYTGGTKVMAVHSYHALEQWKSQTHQPVVVSYLDAADFLMRFESTSAYPKGHQQTVGLAVPLTLEEILSLHENLNYKEKIKRDTRGSAISPLLVQLYRDRDGQGQKAWRGYCENVLKYKRMPPPPRGKRAGEMRTESELALEKLKLIPSERAIAAPLNAVAEALIPGGSGGEKTLQEVRNHHATEFASVTELAEWMDGHWLEEYALDQILSLQRDYQAADESAKLHDCGRNLRINRPMNFEADVAVMRGYQLHLISCYSGSDDNPARLKLFEVFTHARNLGGEAARAALISCVKNPDYIKEQVGQLFGDDRQIAVFGRDDLKDLKLKLKHWFDSGAR